MSTLSDALTKVWDAVESINDPDATNALSVVMEYIDILEGAYDMGDDEAGLYEEGGLLYNEEWNEDDGQPSEHDEWMDYDPDC